MNPTKPRATLGTGGSAYLWWHRPRAERSSVSNNGIVSNYGIKSNYGIADNYGMESNYGIADNYGIESN